VREYGGKPYSELPNFGSPSMDLRGTIAALGLQRSGHRRGAARAARSTKTDRILPSAPTPIAARKRPFRRTRGTAARPLRVCSKGRGNLDSGDGPCGPRMRLADISAADQSDIK